MPKEEEKRKLYEVIISISKSFAENISSPIDTAEFKGTDEERYERAFQKIKEADLIIGEMSEPSTGQGMEIREAAILNKPVIIIAKTGSKVSGLIKGCPVVKEIFFYNNKEDLETKLQNFLKKI